MERINQLREGLPAAASDIKLNLQSVLEQGSLSERQRWGVALACAIAAREPRLQEAVLGDARARLSEADLEDARAAAALMAMNNVFYRFRHFVGKESYRGMPARLRMNKLARPGDKATFELACLAVSAINGCEVCVRSHEEAVRGHGLTEENIFDAVRIASVLQAAAVALGVA